MNKIFSIALGSALALAAGIGEVVADAASDNAAALRSSIEQRMQTRTLEQRLLTQDNNRRTEDSVERARRDARRARERALDR